MSELVKATVLGLVQGATEFVPISSSGHLVLVPWLLGWERPGLLFDTMMHWGTLLSILIVFRADFLRIARAMLASITTRSLVDSNARLGWFIVVGTVPAAVMGLLLKDFFERLFDSPLAAGAFLMVTGLLLLGSELLARQSKRLRPLEQMEWADAIWIGLAQALALAPGISRSGSTIAASLARGIKREAAARYSFLLGTPAFLGAGLLQLADVAAGDAAQLAEQLPVLLVGFATSAVTGILAIRLLLAYLRRRNLYPFAAYCFVVGALVLLVAGR